MSSLCVAIVPTAPNTTEEEEGFFFFWIIKTVTHDGIAVPGLDRHIAVKRMQAFVRKEPFGSNYPAANATTTSTFTNPMNVYTSGVCIL